jgi:hypothetical protein
MQPGRACPPWYRYAPGDLRRVIEIEARAVYVIGGLYGNPFALQAVVDLAAAEDEPPVLVFNGDFHWFDIDPARFARINAIALTHVALRGNVETELASDDTGAGCGCGYPESVSDAEVERSNQILVRLRETAREQPTERARLGGLAMFAVARVGNTRVGIVHGDAWSLSGWRFAQDRLVHEAADVGQAFDDAGVRVFASSHTCLPVLRGVRASAGDCVVINNGAAGMPNFAATRFGLISRIAVTPASQALYGIRLGELYLDALPVHYDHAAWLAEFDRTWPEGSPAALSYRDRIVAGPRFAVEQAVRMPVRQVVT